ncbi:MAG: hypothetical protein KDA69_05500 [Planctomycetaceae bacterium]|nr:hypothetical protein [Planctomycetaceae bacterium]
MQVRVVCSDCGYAEKVAKSRIMKRGRAPKCQLCGKPTQLPAAVRRELAALGEEEDHEVCRVCDAPLKGGVSFCAKCGTSQEGDAREKLAAAQFEFDREAEKRLGALRFQTFLRRIFGRWFW